MNEFQRHSTEQGRRFEDAVEVLALIQGFEVVDRRWRHPVAGIEIDLVLKREDLGEVWVECKGSWRGRTPGLSRGDTLLKAIAVGYLLRQLVPTEERRPYWLVISHQPKEGTQGAERLAAATNLFDRVVVVGLLLPEDLEEEVLEP